MSFELHRPHGYTGRGDRYLPELVKDMKHTLMRAQVSLSFDTLRLPSTQTEELADVLVEFAEDVHNDIGIWNSLEQYNIEFFGTPLPFVLQANTNTGRKPNIEQRIQHLLWVLYSEMNRELILSPTHRDLKQLAVVASGFLVQRFAEVPRGSGVKALLAQPNKFGWNVKRKLIWLGTHSYLFRNSFQNYIRDHGEKAEIPIIDDFLCQQTTAWSGLGVIDILANVLDISEKRRSILRSWYLRHRAYYRVIAIKGHVMEVVNTINDRPYTVRVGEHVTQFKVGQTVSGGLVLWNGEWYWSGEQSTLADITEDELQELKGSFLRQVPQIAYRYCDQLAEKAKEMVNRGYDEFRKYHGDDLVIYPNGLSMAADLQKEAREQWESKPKEVIAQLVEKHKLQRPSPSLSFPREVLENENGVGVYYNPDEGWEVMVGFNDVVSGLKKRGIDLTEDEDNSIRLFIYSDLVSLRFVNRLVQDYGYESIESAFLIPDSHQEYHFEYLLRRYKGAYYRKRYPRIALI